MSRTKESLSTALFEIDQALKFGLFYIALSMTLALPDICACLESPTGDNKNRSGFKYRDWFDRYLKTRLDPLSAEDCYSLRCGVTHTGSFGNNGEFVKILFLLPNKRKNVNIMNIRNVNSGPFHSSNLLCLDIHMFCTKVVEGVLEWTETADQNENVLKNLRRLVRYRNEIVNHAVLFEDVPYIS